MAWPAFFVCVWFLTIVAFRPCPGKPLQATSSRMYGVARRIIQISSVPKPIGPYSQAVQVGNTLYVSGQTGFDPVAMKLVGGGADNQTRKALHNMGEILRAAGAGYENVVRCTVLVTNLNDVRKVNIVYQEFFRSRFPARMAYQVTRLPRGAAVEIDAIAILGQIAEI